MEKYELQKLRDLPIEGVAERLGLRVTRHIVPSPHNSREIRRAKSVSNLVWREILRAECLDHNQRSEILRAEFVAKHGEKKEKKR